MKAQNVSRERAVYHKEQRDKHRMATCVINGIRLFWEQTGEHGAPLVLVHGSLPGPSATVSTNCRAPALLSEGDQSPPFFGVILEKVATALPHAQHHVYRGAGHVPHLTHADEFVNVVSGFVTHADSVRSEPAKAKSGGF